MVTFGESPTFTRQIVEQMSDAEYAEFQQALARNPEMGDVMFYVYTKGRMADLDVEQKKRLRLAVQRIKAEFGR